MDGSDERGKLRAAPLVIIEADGELVVSGWNDRTEALFATPRGAAIGRSLAELLPVAGGAATWRDWLARDGAGPRRLRVDHPVVGARHLDAWVQRTPVADGRPDAITIYAHDVTARVPVEKRQALESTLFHAITRNLDMVVWAIDDRGTFLLSEGKAAVTAGQPEGKFIGLNIFDVYGDAPGNPLRDAIAGKPFRTPPSEVYGVYWETWYIPVREPACDATVVGISLDVTAAQRREAELRTKLDLIERQRETIRELSTPIIEVWDGVLTLPIVGLVDSVRTAEIMDNLLQTVTRTRARYAILDLTGVQVVDTSTASHLIGLIQALRLLGAEGVLTGIHPNIAQTIVAIGLDLSRVRVFATLRDALKYSIAHLRDRA